MHRERVRRAVDRRVVDGGRAVRRAFAPLAIVLAVLLFGAPGTSADIGWCRTDPGVAIGDETVSILVSAPEEILQSATGPTAVVVYVPTGVSAQLMWTDPGFGHGETVTIVESDRLRTTRQGTLVVVAVVVPAATSLPVLVEIVPASAGVVTASATGFTNRTVRLWTTI